MKPSAKNIRKLQEVFSRDDAKLIAETLRREQLMSNSFARALHRQGAPKYEVEFHELKSSDLARIAGVFEAIL